MDACLVATDLARWLISVPATMMSGRMTLESGVTASGRAPRLRVIVQGDSSSLGLIFKE